MQEAVGRFVPDGASVCMGAALEGLIPFAAGCARRIQAAWVGNVSAGLGHNSQRAVEHGVPRRIEVEDHSNLTIAAALLAGTMGAWKGFLSTLGPEAREAVRVKTPRLSEPLDYGA
jgi:glutaconate CoA-transferase subunit A